MNTFQRLQRSYLPELIIALILFSWAASLYFGIKSYQMASHAYALDPSRPAPAFQWGRHLPGLFFILFFTSIRLRQRKAFNQ